MATTAKIENKNGKWASVHWDGYPTGIGATLIMWHNDNAKAEALISRRAIRELCWDGTVDQYARGSKPEPFYSFLYKWDGQQWMVKGPDNRWKELASMPDVNAEVQRRLSDENNRAK